jgi:hypothetical protein
MPFCTCATTLEPVATRGCVPELRAGGGNTILFVDCSVATDFDYLDPVDITAAKTANKARTLTKVATSVTAGTIPTTTIDSCSPPIIITAGITDELTIKDFNADTVAQADIEWWKSVRAKGGNWAYVLVLLCKTNEMLVFDNISQTGGGFIMPERVEEFSRHEVTMTQQGGYLVVPTTQLLRDAILA